VLAYPDTLVGTDSHTTMVNGLGVVGWGVGGIEAEAAMLGQPISMLIPEVVGFRLVDRLPEGATATDLVLTITERLRKLGVVGKFVEFYGPGLEFLTIADRATLGNMSPEYGATIAICPIDDMTLDYLRLTAATRRTCSWSRPTPRNRDCSGQRLSGSRLHATCELDLSTVEPSLAGRNGRRIASRCAGEVQVPAGARRHARGAQAEARPPTSGREARRGQRAGCRAASQRPWPAPRARAGDGRARHGSVVVAAITSCTNTSNPSVMIGAGLLARNAVKRGLKVKPWVKTSLAPGSLVVTEYLQAADCSSISPSSGSTSSATAARPASATAARCRAGVEHRQGPQPDRRLDAQRQPQLRRADPEPGARQLSRLAAAGRRVRDRRQDAGRSHDRAARRRTAPGAGDAEGDLAERARDPGGHAQLGEVRDVPASSTPRVRRRRSLAVAAIPTGERFEWTDDSTYIRNPPFFEGITAEPTFPTDIHGARALAVLGDSVTTDHISPGRLDSRPTARRASTWCRRAFPRRTSTLRRAARQPRGDDARHVRENPLSATSSRPAPKADGRRSCRRRGDDRSTTRR
jgi:aconitate hydratase